MAIDVDAIVIRSSAVLAGVLLWWVMCRARYMTSATRLEDKLALTIVGAAAIGYVAGPWLYAGELFLEPLLLAGITGWVGLPVLRRWMQRQRAAAREPSTDDMT